MLIGHEADYLAMTSEFQRMVDEFFSIQYRYQAAIREVMTKLEILDSEFEVRHRRNPIHHMQSRMKTIQSMMEKLQRRQMRVDMQSAVDNLTDIAGVRVICCYIEDIYSIASLLEKQDDIRILKVHDYIRSPKDNGYRSLHLVLEVPVFLSEGRILVPVEVQIRTIAMDFWASLEHQLRYKTNGKVTPEISEELLDTANTIAALDERMQKIHNEAERLGE